MDWSLARTITLNTKPISSSLNTNLILLLQGLTLKQLPMSYLLPSLLALFSFGTQLHHSISLWPPWWRRLLGHSPQVHSGWHLRMSGLTQLSASTTLVIRVMCSGVWMAPARSVMFWGGWRISNSGNALGPRFQIRRACIARWSIKWSADGRVFAVAQWVVYDTTMVDALWAR